MLKPGAYPDPRVGNPPLSVEEYDAEPGLRSSVLREFALKTPRHARHMLEHARPETWHTRMGTYLHMALLEPERFERTVLVQPHYGYHASHTTKALKAKWEADHPGAEAIKESEMDQLLEWKAEMLSVPTIQRLLTAPGFTELSLLWDDPAGIRCKCRLDRLTTYAGKATKVEIKTARAGDPFRFARQALDLGYHIQDAFYMRGLDEVFGKRERRSILCVLEKGDRDKGIPCLAVPYELDAASKFLGEQIVARALPEYAECERMGIWPGYPAEVNALSLPSWAFKRSASDDELGGDWDLI